MNDIKYQPVIGLEVHVELKTKTKMFCGCLADYFGKEPNTYVCPVCLGLPGALPVPSKKAIDWCLMIGTALGCQVKEFSKFDRKNYFYPDLPKGYQISQYDLPFCERGKIKLAGGKVIGIRRVHMEEDTAKLVHEFGISNVQYSSAKRQAPLISNKERYTLIDFNRSGVPLVEIVTDPDFESASEVVEYLKKLQQIVRYLGVSNADMEKGDMRLEPNISVRQITNRKSQIANRLPSYKVEVKNINSFRFVEKAIAYEVRRQIEILEKGEKPVQETRGWDERKQATVSQRIKEEAQDYRYFPEPDIPPVLWTKSQVSDLKSQIPELPNEKKERFLKEYGLREDQALQLTETKEKAEFYEKAVGDGQEHGITAPMIANVIINKKVPWENKLPAEFIQLILEARQTAKVDEAKLEKVIETVLEENKKAVEDYQKGKDQSIMFLVGQVMKKYKEKIDAKKVRERIENKLKTG